MVPELWQRCVGSLLEMALCSHRVVTTIICKELTMLHLLFSDWLWLCCLCAQLLAVHLWVCSVESYWPSMCASAAEPWCSGVLCAGCIHPQRSCNGVWKSQVMCFLYFFSFTLCTVVCKAVVQSFVSSCAVSRLG